MVDKTQRALIDMGGPISENWNQKKKASEHTGQKVIDQFKKDEGRSEDELKQDVGYQTHLLAQNRLGNMLGEPEDHYYL